MRSAQPLPTGDKPNARNEPQRPVTADMHRQTWRLTCDFAAPSPYGAPHVCVLQVVPGLRV